MAEPAAGHRASGWQVRGSWAGGRKSEADEEGRGRVTNTSEAPSASSFFPGREISFGGYQATLQRWKSVCGPKAGSKSLKWQRSEGFQGSLKLARLWGEFAGRERKPSPQTQAAKSWRENGFSLLEAGLAGYCEQTSRFDTAANNQEDTNFGGERRGGR